MEEDLAKQQPRDIAIEKESEKSEALEKALIELAIEDYKKYGVKRGSPSREASKEKEKEATTLAQTLGVVKPEEKKKKKGTHWSKI